ncbi:MAG: hypothetical protein C5B60_03385 [Chloroflexi bacterium]|nr:MAG: hypothetical protein C5B60_03385 [Chloroflexota bacterium]
MSDKFKVGDKVRIIGPVDQSYPDNVEGWFGYIQRDRRLNKGRWRVWFEPDPTGDQYYAFVDDESLELITGEK